ncbi:3-ketoacyl-ACP reductase, partial [Streptomyces sp. NPDC059766]
PPTPQGGAPASVPPTPSPGRARRAPPAAAPARFPAGRRGLPDDPARLIAWPATDEAERVTGQVVDSEGGLRR